MTQSTASRRRKTLLIGVALLLLAALIPIVARATIGPGNWYVTSTGSDSTGTGTQANPWRSPGKACVQIIAGGFASTGGTLWIAGGLYTGPTMNSVVEADALGYVCQINHFRMRALNDNDMPHLLLADTARDILLGWRGNVTDVEVDHLWLDAGPSTLSCGGCTRNSHIQLRNGPGDAGSGVPSDIRIHDNYFTGGREQGIFTYSFSSGAQIPDLQIVNNVFEGIGDGYGTGGYGSFDHALYLKSTLRAVIRGNLFRNNKGYAIQMQSHIETGDVFYNSDPVIEGNTITGNGQVSGGGIYLYGTFGYLIRNNRITGNGGGINSSFLTGGTINNNTIADNTLTAGVGSVTVNDKIGLQLAGSTGAAITLNQNIIQGNGGNAVTVGAGSSIAGARNVINGTTSGTVTNTSGTTTASTFTSTYELASGASANTLGNLLSPATTTDILGRTRSASTPSAGAFEYGSVYFPAPLSTATPPPAPSVGVGSSDTDERPLAVPTAPTGSGVTRTAVDLAALTTALGAANPGDRIVLTGSTYTLTSNLTMSRSGTLANPIVIASTTPLSATITGPYSITTTGNDVTWHQITFSGMAVDSPLRVSVSASTGLRVRFSANTFTNVGNGADGATNGVIRRDSSLSGDADGLGGTLTTTSSITDRNTFGPALKNIPVWQDQWIAGDRIDHNTVTGTTAGITGGSDTTAFKVGFGFGDEVGGTRVDHNTTPSTWRGAPATIAIRQSGAVVDHNQIGAGAIMLRHGNANTVQFNRIDNGSIEGGGTSSIVRWNWVSTNGDPTTGYGPLVVWAKGTSVGYDGTSGTPILYQPAVDWLVNSNVLISTTADLGSIIHRGNATAVWSAPSEDSLFWENEIYRPSPSSTWFAAYGSGSPLQITASDTFDSTNEHFFTSPVGVYVRKSGTDNSTCGTTAAPCRTWAYALTNRVPVNGLMRVGSGVWAEADLNPSHPSEPLCTDLETNYPGSFPGRHIPNGVTIEPEGGYGTATIYGYARPRTTLMTDECPALITIRGTSTGITIRGFVIDGGNADRPTAQNGDATNQGSEFYLIGMYGKGSAAPSSITLSNNTIQNCMISCVYAKGSDTVNSVKVTDLTLTRNTYANCGERSFLLGGCIYLKGTNRSTVSYSTFSNAHVYAIQLQADIVVGGTFQYGQDATIIGNTVTTSGTRTGDVTAAAGGGGAFWTLGYFGTMLANNDFHDNYGVGINLVTSADLTAIHNTLRNNSTDFAGTKYQMTSEWQGSPTLTNNVIIGSAHKAGGAWDGSTNIITGSVVQGTTNGGGDTVPVGANNLTGTTTTAPTFVSTTDLHLASSASAGYNAGTVTAITLDHDEFVRSSPDIGAYEFGAAPATTTTTSTTTTVPGSTTSTTSTIPGIGGGCQRTEAEAMTFGGPGGTSMPIATAHAGYTGTGYRQYTTSATYLDGQVTTSGPGWTVTARYSSSLAVDATRSLFADYTNPFPNVSSPQLFTLPPTAGVWATVTASLPSEYGTAGTHDISISWNNFSPFDSGSIELDYLEWCPPAPPATTTTSTSSTTSTSTTTTLAFPRSVTLRPFVDLNSNGVQDLREGPMARTAFVLVRMDTGAAIAFGRFLSGQASITYNLAAEIPMRVDWYPPLRATTPRSVVVPLTGESTVKVGGCCGA